MNQGTNCEIELNGDKLVIEVDLTQTHGGSKSGKTLTVGTTHGFVSLAGLGKPEIIVSLNVNLKRVLG